MFDLGFFELLVIAVVALVVLGPERLPKAARVTGLWVRKARAQWYSVKSEFERELAAEELKRSLVEPAAQLRDQVSEVRSAVADVDREIRETAAPIEATSPAPAPEPEPVVAPDVVDLPVGDLPVATLPVADSAAPDDAPAQTHLDFGAPREPR